MEKSASGPTKCERVVLMVNVPPETPKGAKLYFPSNQNNWDPGDTSSMMCQDELGRYIMSLDKIEGLIEYRLTRGSWDSEELDENRQPIPNRTFVFGKQDTVKIKVDAWKDIIPGLEARNVTLLVKMPFTTRSSDPVYVCGTFNNWNPADEAYRLKFLDKNLYAITFRKPVGKMEFKFTRGSWDKQEVDQYHHVIANRTYASQADTLRLKVQGWADRNPKGMK